MFYISRVSLVCAFSLLIAACNSTTEKIGEGKKISPDSRIIIKDLKYPKVDSNNKITGEYKDNLVLKYSDYDKYNDASGAVRRLFHKFSEEFKKQDDNTLHISKEKFREDCVIPYINGLWLSSKTGLLRKPNKENIKSLANDHMIEVTKDSASYSYELKEEGGWPIYYPPQFEEQIRSKYKDVNDVQFIPLPKDKPPYKALDKENGKWKNQKNLYNHIGLLYLPNNYIVPGGLFNEMFGWDSYFMILGLINSAEYILENPDAEIYFYDEGYRKAEPIDAYRMFKTAKGMVDNHIFEIFFYGGKVLNANRTYLMSRSQPPFLTSEALKVYEFWEKYGSKLKEEISDDKTKVGYYDTLSQFLKNDKYSNNYETPTNYKEWLKREVFPAAVAYFNYYANPRKLYEDWSPFKESDSPYAIRDYKHENVDPNYNRNKRVVTINPDTSDKRYNLARYYTHGEGPCPEIVFSTAEGNKKLYNKVYPEYFKNNPNQNPDSIYYNTNKDKLTDWFYKNDRAIRASGFDLSLRYGGAGQYSLDYIPLALNTLLYKMGQDIIKMRENINTQTAFYGLGGQEMLISMDYIRNWTKKTPEYINSMLWNKKKNVFADKKFRIRNKNKNSSAFTYPFITGFCPFMVDIAKDSYSPKNSEYPFVPSEQTKNKFQNMLNNKEIEKIYGITTSFNDTGGETQWDFPVSWAPNEYFAFKAYDNEGIKNTSISSGWKSAIDIYFANYGKIIEKYPAHNPLGEVKVSKGYAINNAGFGWTNGIYMMFVNNKKTGSSKE